METIFKNKFLLTLTFALCFFVACFNKTFAAYVAPAPTGYVDDFAHVLDTESIDRLTNVILELKSKTGAEVVVVTLPSLDGYPIEDVGLTIGRQWGVGQKGKDNGVVIVTAINDRKMRIEVGYGLEATLTDAHAGRIRDEYMIPYFKKGDYQDGIIYGTSAVASAIAKAYGVSLSGNYDLPAPQSGEVPGLIYWIYFIVLIFLCIKYPSFMMVLMLGGGRSSGGGFGGGSSFGGFGGGGFGGGGASGGW